MTADRDFLFWLHERLTQHYHENANTDFVQKLAAIAEQTPPDTDTIPFWTSGKDRFYALPDKDGCWSVYDREDSTVKYPLGDAANANMIKAVLNLAHLSFQDELERVMAATFQGGPRDSS